MSTSFALPTHTGCGHEVQERLQRLVESFTVLSHKAIGKDANAIASDRGDARGTLTIS